MGNSYCNRVSYEIMKRIESGELKSRYTFLHIPKGFEVDEALVEVNCMLKKASNDF